MWAQVSMEFVRVGMGVGECEPVRVCMCESECGHRRVSVEPGE